MTEIALKADGISKRYGALVAVDQCSFELAKGEVHVLLGSNGCGKSTLCKVMAGAVSADAGDVILAGRKTAFRNPLDAKAAGIATVYQEMSLIPTLTVAENILLSVEPSSAGRLNRAAMAQSVANLIAGIGTLASRLDPNAFVGELPIDQQQIVEILKSLVHKPRVILFDESTSSLDRSQVLAFFELVRSLKADGVSIIFVTHRMEEIFAIADRVTVMQNGRYIATRAIGATNRDELVELMVGGKRERADRGRSAEMRPAVLTVSGLSGRRLSNVSMTLREGEILGLGGLHGQGQSDFLLSLFGAVASTGTVTFNETPYKPGSPLQALSAGLCYVSGDRGRAGALHGRPIIENLALSKLSRSRAITANPAGLAKSLEEMVGRLKLKFGRFSHAIGTLSGGNQQKVILGRALAAAPRVLLLDDPTKGIDVRAKDDLYRLIRELGTQGTAVILYSSEDHELLENADRVLVFNGGQIVDELEGARLTEFDLYSAALRSAA
jgi:ribose transport system ATP-binding protein